MVFAPFSRNSSFGGRLTPAHLPRTTGTARPCYRSISIVADGRLDVCDGWTARL